MNERQNADLNGSKSNIGEFMRLDTLESPNQKPPGGEIRSPFSVSKAHFNQTFNDATFGLQKPRKYVAEIGLDAGGITAMRDT